jgi:hypothetical protein
MEDRGDQDFLVYPIVFIYRHHVELQMKELIRNGRRLLDVDGDFDANHNLVRLWSACREVLEQVFRRGEREALDAIGEQLQQLAALDAGSYAFRYPEDRAGAPSLPPELRRFNLRHFAERMERIGGMLEGASTGISVYLDYKADMRSEYLDYEADMRSEAGP